MKKKVITVIAGDGIGPEVVEAALQLLKAFSLPLEFNVKDWGAQKWQNEKISLPSNAIEELQKSDAILLGAIGTAHGDQQFARDIILGIRQKLDLYINLRPIFLLHSKLSPLKKSSFIDWVIIRENTQDMYTGAGSNTSLNTNEEIATDKAIYTYTAVERAIRFAFEMAHQKNRQKVTLIDKANAIVHTGRLWQRVFKAISSEYPHIQTTHEYVDSAAYKMILHPEEFDLIITSNLFGDILSDLAAALIGGLWFCPSTNFHPNKKPHLYEPVHGSAPLISGKGIANPIATILSSSLMLEDLGFRTQASQLKNAIISTLSDDHFLQKLINKTATTKEITALIADKII